MNALFLLALTGAVPPTAPDFSLALEPTTAMQGSLVMVHARSLGGRSPRDLVVTWKDITAHGIAWKGGELMALLPVKMQQRLGTQEITVLVTDARGVRHKAGLSLTVVPGDFDTDVLGVKKSFLEPNKEQRAHAKEDSETFEALWKHLDANRHWKGPFMLPVDNITTARFGTFRTLNGRTKSRHMGLDVRGKKGDLIKASNDGRVALARNCFYSGNTVVVDHGNGVTTLYFHMTKMAVKPGQQVKRGQLLGYVGDTGRVTGPHLHWGVKFSNVYIDPQKLLALKLDDDPRMPVKMAPPPELDAGIPVVDAAVPVDMAAPPDANAAQFPTSSHAADAGELQMSIPEDDAMP